jgi:hypothetical protein
MARKKIKVKLQAYGLIEDAVYSGLGFALNRLDDAGVEITEAQRDAASGPMLNEVMIALSEVIDVDRSG